MIRRFFCYSCFVFLLSFGMYTYFTAPYFTTPPYKTEWERLKSFTSNNALWQNISLRVSLDHYPRHVYEKLEQWCNQYSFRFECSFRDRDLDGAPMFILWTRTRKKKISKDKL